MLWKEAAMVLYDGLDVSFEQYPKKLYTVEFPTSPDAEEDTVLLTFLAKLETFLETKSTALNLTTLWEMTHPAGIDANLDDFLNITYPILISKEQTMLVRDPFYAAYGAVHDERRPFVDPAPLVVLAALKTSLSILKLKTDIGSMGIRRLIPKFHPDGSRHE